MPTAITDIIFMVGLCRTVTHGFELQMFSIYLQNNFMKDSTLKVKRYSTKLFLIIVWKINSLFWIHKLETNLLNVSNVNLPRVQQHHTTTGELFSGR